MPAAPWTFGDRVRHPTKPEWGVGHVTAVEPAQIDGVATHRVTVRFERAGLKKLAASVAKLQPADQPAEQTADRAIGSEPATTNTNGQPRSDEDLRDALIALPGPARDPFSTLQDRFRHALAAYRFNARGASLLDWASSQCDLADPLTRFSRHELEAAFARFRRQLDQHTTALGLELVRRDPAAAGRLVQQAPDDAKALMRTLAGGR